MTTYLETHSTDPYYNLAFEDYVLTHRRNGDYLMLWQNDNAVIIGQNQNTEEEINHAFVEEHGIRVVRRNTGGGAVYHDLGNLNYSFITDCEEYDKASLVKFTEPVAAALRALGLDAAVSGRNDILVSGKKISGTAQRIAGHRILHHGTLLFASNPEMVAGALKVNPLKFRSKGTKSVASRVGNISDYLPEKMTLKAFWDYLKKALSAGDFAEDALSAEELKEVRALRDSKYATWEWNYGRSPRYEKVSENAFPGGLMTVSLSVDRGGILEAVSFTGDFLSRRDVKEVEAALKGCPLRQEELSARLEALPVEDYFGAITTEEIVQSLLR